MRSDHPKNICLRSAFLCHYLCSLAGLFSAGIIPDYLLPSPGNVVERLWELGEDGYSLPSIKATIMQGMAVGFSIAAVIGLGIGFMMGLSRVINSCLRSLFLGLQTLPTAAWVRSPSHLRTERPRDLLCYYHEFRARRCHCHFGRYFAYPASIYPCRILGTAWYAMPGR
jgi:NitT/TauT family transport system permease protein